MIISHFNRYFEKHGRKTYIVLGIIISLMFVVFISGGMGDLATLLGGRGRLDSYGTMYGKKLKVKDMQKSMQETYMAMALESPYAVQQMNDSMLFFATLNRMRYLHEAKAQGLDKVDDAELVAKIQSISAFRGEDGAFSQELFQNFKKNMLAGSINAADFDRVMRESIIIKRLEDSITKDVKADEAEVTSYVEKYTAKFTTFTADEQADANPSEQEINDFFAKRSADIKLPDGRSAVVAQFSVDVLIGQVAAGKLSADVVKQIEPTAEAIADMFEKYKETTYKGKTLDDVKNELAKSLRKRNARNYLEGQADKLSERYASHVQDEAETARIQRFESDAKAMGAAIVTTGYVTGTDVVPGFSGREPGLAAHIRKLEKVGDVTGSAFMIKGPAVAMLKDRKATAMPAEMNDEIKNLVIDKLVTEKALAMYKEKVLPFAEMAAASTDENGLMRDEIARLQADATKTTEQKEMALYEYQQMLRNIVIPFYAGERRSFTVAFFDYSKYLDDVVVTDEMLKAAYDAKAAEYQKKEVRLAKIQFETIGLDGEALAAKKVKAEAALKQLTDGADFSEVAAKESEHQDGDEDEFVAVNSLDASLAKGIADLEAGQLSGIIEGNGHLVIAKVLERRDGRTLEQVKEELTQAVKEEKAREMADKEAEQLSDDVSGKWYVSEDNGDEKAVRPLAEASSLLNAQTALFKKAQFLSFDKLTKNGYLNAQLGRDAALLDSVFKSSNEIPLTNAISGTKGAYVSCLTEVVKPMLRNPENDDVAMATIKRIYRRETAYGVAATKAAEEAKRVNAALAEGKDFAAAAGETKYRDIPEFSRFDLQPLSQLVRLNNVASVVTEFGKAPVNAVMQPMRAENGAAVIYLASKAVPEDADTKTMMENVRTYLLNRNKQEALNKYSEKLEADSETYLSEALSKRK